MCFVFRYYSYMQFTHISKNGTLIPLSEATIPVNHIEYAYGYGVYENLRVLNGKVLFINDHLERLQHSAKVIELVHPFTTEQLKQWTMELVASVPTGVFNLKMLLIGGREPGDCLLFILPLSPLFPEKKLYTQGATAITYPYERLFPQAKTLNMLGSYLAYKTARAQGAYDALLINRDGHITEGTRTNFFTITKNTITMPPMRDILEGVTLKHVLHVARKHTFTVVEKNILPADLDAIDGAFITSTSTKIMPLKKIDDRALPPIPEALKALMKHFDAFVEKE